MSEIIRGAERIGPRVRKVTPMPGHNKLRIEFSNDEAFFRLVRAEYGTICWPEDIDYCPDTLYMQSVACE